MTNEELMDYAIKGVRADVTQKGVDVRHAMVRMKEALDASPPGGSTRLRLKSPIDGLMEALAALDESMDKAEKLSRESYGGKEVQQ